MHWRMGYIGGSDAKRILDGDWHELWLEKTGAKEPEDLSGNFQVQLGLATEKFHAEWLKRIGFGDHMGRPARPYVHPQHEMLQGSPDLIYPNSFIDMKHTNAFATQESILHYYLPQVAHYCNVLGVDYGWLSCICGNAEPTPFKVTPPKQYRDELLAHELRFWWHVTENVAPDIIGKGALERTNNLAGETLVDDMRSVDMNGNNLWASYAATFLETKPVHAAHEAVKKQLKELVEPDVRQATGHGIEIKRNKRGALTIYLTGQEAAE